MGPMGQLASLLFKAEKTNMQAKSYSGRAPVSRRPYGDYSKDRMQEMLEKAIGLLDAHAKTLGIPWGWGKDDVPGKPPWVLNIDLPAGQVTYRLPERSIGPDYETGSEGDSRNESRITGFCAGVLYGRWMYAEEDILDLPASHLTTQPATGSPTRESQTHSLYNRFRKQKENSICLTTAKTTSP